MAKTTAPPITVSRGGSSLSTIQTQSVQASAYHRDGDGARALTVVPPSSALVSSAKLNLDKPKTVMAALRTAGARGPLELWMAPRTAPAEKTLTPPLEPQPHTQANSQSRFTRSGSPLRRPLAES